MEKKSLCKQHQHHHRKGQHKQNAYTKVFVLDLDWGMYPNQSYNGVTRVKVGITVCEQAQTMSETVCVEGYVAALTSSYFCRKLDRIIIFHSKSLL